MVERNKLPAIATPANEVGSAEQPGSLVARGLEAIGLRNKNAFLGLSDAELAKRFRDARKRGDYEEAVNVVLVLEKRGRALAEELCNELFDEAQLSCLSYGDDDDDNAAAARVESVWRCVRHAAEQASPLFQDLLGELYCYGTWAEEGDPDDNAEAAGWTRKAAEQGRMGSQINLGIMYYEGKKGLPRDYSEALKWFRAASDHGSKFACFKIGEMYYRGEGVRQDYAEAMRWYGTVIEHTDESDDYGMLTDVLFKIAEMYSTGTGVVKNQVRAYMWIAILLKISRFDLPATQLAGELASQMTPAQIAEAQRLAGEWTQVHAP